MSKTSIIDIDHEALSALMMRIEEAINHDLALSVDDMKLLLCAITTLCTLQSKMAQDDVTLHKLRKLLGMVKQSERRQPAQQSSTSIASNQRNKKQPKIPRQRKQLKPPKIVHHPLQDHHKGELCTGCQRGKLYKFEPATLLRITGHARYEATRHIVEQLRCNACQLIYKASLPASVLEDGDANQKYGYSARTLMVIDKFYTGTPYHHQSNLADIFGCAISASTIFDQCEQVANVLTPVFHELQRQAANARRFLLDDTHNRILAQQPELREKPNGTKQIRTGIYTSGLIAAGINGYDIILFNTSLGHAGEHLNAILLKRDAGLPPPLIMSDALSSNTVTKVIVKSCYCNAHARRQFYDLEKLYPNEIKWLLDQYGLIWQHDAFTKNENMGDLQRLSYHQTYSLPVMKSIYDWAQVRQASPAFEEYSALGKAINYFLKHYEKLIMFCIEEGALLDNNRMEEKLKIVIRGRKSSHFYKTVTGADVANILISLIATADQAQENIYDYLQALQKNQTSVKANPAYWLPWSYRKSIV
jgi:transposase